MVGMMLTTEKTTLVLSFACVLFQADVVGGSPWKRWMGAKFVEEEALNIEGAKQQDVSYGVDVSFPMHHHHVSTLNSPFGTAIQEMHQDYMKGCKEYFRDEAGKCDASEKRRIDLNLNQPPISQNFTSLGFAKIRAPKDLMQRLGRFYEANAGKEAEERVPAAATYTNQWSLFSYSMDVKSDSYKGGGPDLEREIVEATRPILEAWTGESLSLASVYGLRIDIDGTILAPLVDLPPLVISAAINVAQDEVAEPWPFEVIGHDGLAYHIDMQPGDMVLYEGHSVIHGRPFPLIGKSYANLYVHFEPFGYSQRLESRLHEGNEERKPKVDELENLYKASMAKQKNAATKYKHLPDYIVEGTEEEPKWSQHYSYEKSKQKPSGVVNEQLGQTSAHTAAAIGDVSRLRQIAAKDPTLLHKEDANGWKPLHEAARSGSTKVIEYLIEQGADVNERTNQGKGASPLWWAEQFHDEHHSTVKLLRKLGAIVEAPDLD